MGANPNLITTKSPLTMPPEPDTLYCAPKSGILQVYVLQPRTRCLSDLRSNLLLFGSSLIHTHASELSLLCLALIAPCSGQPLHRQTIPTLSDAGTSVTVSCFWLHTANPQPIISAWWKRCVCLVFKVMKTVFLLNVLLYSWIKWRESWDSLVYYPISDMGIGANVF